MDKTLNISASPHLHTRESTTRIMWLVTAALLPSGIAGVYIFGPAALWTILIGIASAVAAECAIQAVMKKKITINDGSAVLTGLLLAYNLPAHCPFWIPVIGSFVAIAIGKQIFGGLGQNIFNPALVGRVFLMASWPQYMTTFTKPLIFDTVTQATPLALLKENKLFEHISYLDLFLGNRRSVRRRPFIRRNIPFMEKDHHLAYTRKLHCRHRAVLLGLWRKDAFYRRLDIPYIIGRIILRRYFYGDRLCHLPVDR
jgi:Na+-translocating ferredoxin:NAD+ oxidoreductase RnfD subunit